MTVLIFWCGIAHIILSLGSLIIPRVLNWKKGLDPLARSVRHL